MKFLVIIAMTITSFATLASHNYIVKLKSGLKSNHKINKTLKSLGNTQSLNTSFGSFQLVTAITAKYAHIFEGKIGFRNSLLLPLLARPF